MPKNAAALTIPPEIRDLLASTIAEAGGNEVFFLGRVAWQKNGGGPRLEEVDVLGRGNRAAAPAIIERAEEWDVAIHNHPSGVLEPSDADLSVASELGNREVGFVIIDNRAERHYVVVPPFERLGGEQPIDEREVDAVFAPGGPLEMASADYELRAGQVAMAREVAAALNEHRVAAVEAGTGVGKSFAYLIPAILWAERNRSRVVISTNTINLQEQLIGKDLPFLERVLPVKFRYALIKGRGNYACRRKLHELETDAASDLPIETPDEGRQLRELIAWAKTAREGSLSELGAPPPQGVWEKAMSESDKSLKVNCPFYGECFYYQAKRAAFKAHVVVVNHHLFFADLAVRRATGNYDRDLVIPAYQRVVFDEAHHLEDVASQFFGVRITQIGVRNKLRRLRSSKDPKKGALPHLSRRLRREGAIEAAETLEQGLLQDLPGIALRVEERFAAAKALVEAEARRRAVPAGGEAADGALSRATRGSVVSSGDEPDGERKVRLLGDPEEYQFRRSLEEELRGICEELAILRRQDERVIEALERSSELTEDRRNSLALELTSLRDRLGAQIEDIGFFGSADGQGHVRWAEVRGRPGDDERSGVCLVTSPVRVADDLKSAVYDPLKSVVLTSATLSVDRKIDYLGQRLGLDLLDGERFRFREFPSPFDYARQALVLVPDDLPDPDAPLYQGRIREVILETLKRTRGRAFVLFTSYSLLRRTWEALEGPLRAEGIRALRQGEMGRSELLLRFRSGPPHALFGTDSFWEGVDVKGDALSCVVITRLPFRVPNEPVQIARVEDLKRRGQDPFSTYSVPQAVLKFKQGFGRLIRSATDRGVVVVLDRRVITKRYGQAFLRSLPPARLARAPSAAALDLLEEFFGAPSEKRRIPEGSEQL